MLLFFTKQYYLVHKDWKVTDKLNLILRCFTSVTECHPHS